MSEVVPSYSVFMLNTYTAKCVPSLALLSEPLILDEKHWIPEIDLLETGFAK